MTNNGTTHRRKENRSFFLLVVSFLARRLVSFVTIYALHFLSFCLFCFRIYALALAITLTLSRAHTQILNEMVIKKNENSIFIKKNLTQRQRVHAVVGERENERMSEHTSHQRHIQIAVCISIHRKWIIVSRE